MSGATLRATVAPTDGSDLNWITPALQAEFLAYDCADEANDPANEPADQPLIACDPTGTAKYLLGPVLLEGNLVNQAQAGVPQSSAARLSRCSPSRTTSSIPRRTCRPRIGNRSSN